jgi:hypothetical protein
MTTNISFAQASDRTWFITVNDDVVQDGLENSVTASVLADAARRGETMRAMSTLLTNVARENAKARTAQFTVAKRARQTA